MQRSVRGEVGRRRREPAPPRQVARWCRNAKRLVGTRKTSYPARFDHPSGRAYNTVVPASASAHRRLRRPRIASRNAIGAARTIEKAAA